MKYLMVRYPKKEKENKKEDKISISKRLLLRPVKSIMSNVKDYWIAQNPRKPQKKLLPLDDPEMAIIINNQLLLTVERKYLSLYEINNLKISLKDFDCSSLAKNINFIELKSVEFKQKLYAIVFASEKITAETTLVAYVY